MVMIIAFMGCWKPISELYMCPPPMRKGHGPACLSRALWAHPHGGALALGVHLS